MGKKEVSYKSRVHRDKAIGYLEELIAGLKGGTVYLQNDGEYVSLSPTDEIEIEVEAVEKKEKEKLTIELSWSRRVAEPERRTDLKISTTEPEIEEVAETVEGEPEEH